MSHEKQTEILHRLLKERPVEFADIKQKIDLNNLLYQFSSSENKPKDFWNYQMSWELSGELTEGR